MGWFKKTFGFSSQPVTKAVTAPFKIYEPSFWEKPAEGFAEMVDDTAGILPKAVRPYAAPVIGAGLSIFNPFLGAGFNTAYNAGKQQQAGGDFDWSDFGKDAVINFGTAGVADWAKNAGATRTAKSLVANKAQYAPQFSEAVSGAVGSGTGGAASGAGGVLEAFKNVSAGVPSISSNYKPVAQLQSSEGAWDKFKTGAQVTAEKSAPQLANQALTATLSPEGTKPIGGMDMASGLADSGVDTPAYGDALRAFGSADMLTPDANGQYTVDPDAAARGFDAISANNWMQKSARRDQFLPAGQTSAAENTPYNTQLGNIEASTEQYQKDFTEQLNQAAMTKELMRLNPSLTSDKIMEYKADPSKLPETMRPFFQQLNPIFF